MKPSNMIKYRHRRLDRIAKKLGRLEIRNLDVAWAALDNARDDLMLLKGGYYKNYEKK